MKKVTVLCAALLVAVFASASLAEEVSQASLSALGLGEMQSISDVEGMEVRGLSSNAQATSYSTFSMFLFDPNTGFNASFNSADFGRATDENAGLNAASSATTTSAATNAPVVATITFNGVTWTANIGTILVGGNATATSP